ncbi:MAG: DUF1566 domain-containing protein, partial [Deltaproteobacteria bacterium]|nr:DUF1566 domain-containing protein [Deltaproteobacteria bacterium]
DNDFFWTQDYKADDNYWGFNFNLGAVLWWSAAAQANGRCVRGDAPSEFADPGATIVDAPLGLEWEKGSDGPFTWQNAMAHCQGLETPPGGGWRLPTAKELMTIYLPGAGGGAFPAGFSQPVQSYWSSTPEPGGLSMAIVVNYSAPNITVGAARPRAVDETYYAICVRPAP